MFCLKQKKQKEQRKQIFLTIRFKTLLLSLDKCCKSVQRPWEVPLSHEWVWENWDVDLWPKDLWAFAPTLSSPRAGIPLSTQAQLSSCYVGDAQSLLLN